MSNMLETPADYAGPLVLKRPGITHSWKRPQDLPTACIDFLMPILVRVKILFLPGSPVTAREKELFLRIIFQGWATGDFTGPPSDDTKAARGDSAVEFGILAEDAPASSAESQQSQSRVLASESDAGLSAPPTVQEHRKKGQPVWLKVVWQEPGFVFQRRDKQSWFLREDQPVYHTILSQDEAYYRAMFAWDKYRCRKINNFNMRMAVYLARNRLTHWLNGEPTGTIPAYENINRALVPVRMCRYAKMVPDYAKAALARLKEDPEPDLFCEWCTAP